MKKKTPGAAVPDQSPGSVSTLDTKSAIDTAAHNKTQDAQEDNVITVDTNVDPELNPSSPDFNIKKYREYLSTLDIDAIQNRLEKAVKRANDAAAAATYEITQSGIIPRALEETAIESLQDIIAISEWATKATAQILTPQLRKLFDVRDSLADFNWKSFIAALQAGEQRLQNLEPFLEKELPAIREQPGLEETTIDDLLKYIALDGETITEAGEPIPAEIRAALERAIEAARRANLPKATAKRADIVEYPLDKVNFEIWNLIKEPTGRQLKLNLDMSKDGSKEKVPAYYSIDFGELEKQGVKVSKKLMPFDKRVYIAISALYNAGNNVITLTQIHYAMGNTSRPADTSLQKIQDSITKMTTARIFFDNVKESEAYNYNRYQYNGSLLPLEQAVAIVNGKLADAAIHIFREPPIMTFAKQRKQVTTITVKVLQSPISKTDANLMIDDYLIERIAQAKNGRQPNKILYSKIYDRAQITTPSQRTRAPEKIKKYLEHYKACGLISAYKMKEDGITVEFAPLQ